VSDNKKMGRPPASWMFKLADLPIRKQWTDAYEVAEILGLHVKTVKSFFSKLPIQPLHIVENAKTRAQFKVKELKEAAKSYVEPWL
jgi:hypothetical protein